MVSVVSGVLESVVLTHILQLLRAIFELGVDLEEVDSPVLPPRRLLIQNRHLITLFTMLLRKYVVVLMIPERHTRPVRSLFVENPTMFAHVLLNSKNKIDYI